MKRNIFFTITMVFIVCCLMVTDSLAAKRVKFYKANANDYIRMLNEKPGQGMADAFGMTRDEDFILIHQGTDFNGITHSRYRQTYKGIPVWGIQTVVSMDGDKVVRLNGDIVLETNKDIADIPASLVPLNALKKMEEEHKKIAKNARWNFSNEQYGTYIYIDEQDKAHLCYVVSFFADTEYGDPSQYIHFADVENGKILRSFDMLRYANGTGPGGNVKIGQYEYGTDYPPFEVYENGTNCIMITEDVRTVDLNHGSTGTDPFSYTCYRNTHEPVNGGYCPLNDAHSFGQQVFNMYNNWYGVPPIPFQLVLKCHYMVNYDGWFSNGGLVFGDGDVIFFPTVGLDIIGHEVSHGFTESYSNLTYSGQPGGINEAFSDMAGEAAKYYVRGTNDFMFAADICKSCTALRYLYDPPLDGHSIDHVDDYYEGMDVHFSSGIFNKAFYLIATSSGWTTHMAFDIFVQANMCYWTASSTFQQAAECVGYAAQDYGYPYDDVKNAFLVVGINIDGSVPCPGTIANPGFETGDTSGWTGIGNVGVTSDSHTGSYAVILNDNNTTISNISAVEQVIVNLCGSATYTVSCWGKARSTANVYLGVKDYGGAEKRVQFTDYKNFVKKSITFTTGAANTGATIFFIISGSRFTGIGDDFEIIQN